MSGFRISGGSTEAVVEVKGVEEQEYRHQELTVHRLYVAEALVAQVTDTKVYLSQRWERVKSTSRPTIPARPIHDGTQTLPKRFSRKLLETHCISLSLPLPLAFSLSPSLSLSLSRLLSLSLPQATLPQEQRAGGRRWLCVRSPRALCRTPSQSKNEAPHSLSTQWVSRSFLDGGRRFLMSEI